MHTHKRDTQSVHVGLPNPLAHGAWVLVRQLYVLIILQVTPVKNIATIYLIL